MPVGCLLNSKLAFMFQLGEGLFESCDVTQANTRLFVAKVLGQFVFGVTAQRKENSRVPFFACCLRPDPSPRCPSISHQVTSVH